MIAAFQRRKVWYAERYRQRTSQRRSSTRYTREHSNHSTMIMIMHHVNIQTNQPWSWSCTTWTFKPINHDHDHAPREHSNHSTMIMIMHHVNIQTNQPWSWSCTTWTFKPINHDHDHAPREHSNQSTMIMIMHHVNSRTNRRGRRTGTVNSTHVTDVNFHPATT